MDINWGSIITGIITSIIGGTGTLLYMWRKERREMRKAVATYYASLIRGHGGHPRDSEEFQLMLVSLRENGYIDQAYELEEMARSAGPVWDTTDIRAYMDKLLTGPKWVYSPKKIAAQKINI